MRRSTATSSLLLALCLAAGAACGQWLETTIYLPDQSCPHGLCYNPHDNKVYCANHSSGNLIIIDGATNQVIKTLEVGGSPLAMCYVPVGNRIYCANYFGTSVAVIDGSTDTVVKQVLTGRQPAALCYSPQNNRVYTANLAGDNVSVIDCATDSAVATIAVGHVPMDICYNSRGNRVYCANGFSANVSVIDGTGDSVIATVAVGSHPTALCYSLENNSVYCACYYTDTVVVMDGETDSIVAAVRVQDGPFALCYNPQDNKVYCANLNGISNATVIDGATNSVVATVGYGYRAQTLCYNPTNDKVYLAYASSNIVTVIDGVSNEVVRTIDVGRFPEALCHNSIDNRVYVANYASSTISVLRDSAVRRAWIQQPSMPSSSSGGLIKDGGWLSYDQSRGLIYAARGNKSADFYCYNPVATSWRQLASVPAGRENKPPSKGAAGAASGSGIVYATKGNNTAGFYRYVASVDSWYQLADVPLGTTNERVKGGTDLTFVEGDTDYVYLLKGYKNEFWRYSPDRDSWFPLAAAPASKYDKGSWLVLDDSSGIIYAHQAKIHMFSSYDIPFQRWSTDRIGMPFVGTSGKSKKSKDGGCAAWLNDHVYALKGGNTQEFWRYNPKADSWQELDTVPQRGRSAKRRKVKGGADLTAVPGALYATKGNNTAELWRYSAEDTQDAVSGPSGGCGASDMNRASLVMNFATIVRGVLYLPPSPFPLPVGEGQEVRRRSLLLDISGRTVLSLSPGRNDVSRLSPGVYFVRRAYGVGREASAVTKVVVAR